MSHTDTSSRNSGSLYGDVVRDFYDAVIKVEGVEFHVHKVILCKSSSYFRALFTLRSSPGRRIFDIPGLSPDMMQLIIKFAYTGSVSVTENNVRELLLAASQFNILGIIKFCCDFLTEHLHSSNCIGFWQLINIYPSNEAQHKAFCYVTGHFEEVVRCEEFLQLSLQELTGVLESDDLNVRGESTVFEAILRWISHVPQERQEHIALLLSKVRLGLMSEEYIMRNVFCNELVAKNNECLHIVIDALHIMHRSSVTSIYHPTTRPRLPDAILLAIGGWSCGDPTNGIEAYDFCTDRWISVTNTLEHPRCYHGTAYLNGSVYCVGGSDRVEFFNSMRRLDLSTHTWHEAAPMCYRRRFVSVAALKGCIYAIGGYDGNIQHRSAERYRPETNQWTLIASMHERRSDASCTTLLNKIYICGGFNGTEILQTSEFYNTLTDQWTMIAPMNSQRSGTGIVAYADRIYAVGGYNGSSRLCSAEAYNPCTNTWHAVSSMLTPRSNFGIEVINYRIFVVGGFDGFTATSNVEYYDVQTDEWYEARAMDLFRSALSCCVVPRLPNMTSYVVPRDPLTFFDLGEESVESGESDTPEL